MAGKKVVIHTPEIRARPHNGEGRPDLQFPDPITGERIGGQVAALRMAMRYPHTVYPWARRQGKTKFRQFLFQNEAAITPGPYWAGIVYPDHSTAFKIAENFIQSWGSFVKDFKNNDKDQERWIELMPFTPPVGKPAPAWFTPDMKERWERCQGGDRNTSCRIYFWGGSHPHYKKIQGRPHGFHRVDWDEAQQIHPGAYGIVRPLLRDIPTAKECISGTPWLDDIGNRRFHRWWDLAGQHDAAGWFRMRIPDGANPHVPRTDMAAARREMTEQEIQQSLFARFLTGEGAIFSNIDGVLVLPFIPPSDSSCDWVRAIRRRCPMPTMEWYIHRHNTPQGHVALLSVDWARSPRGDYTCISIMDATNGDQLALFRWRGENFNEQLEAVCAIAQRYGTSQNHADANGMGEAMADFMRRRNHMGFVGHKFGSNKRDYVRRAQILFVDSAIRLIDCPPQRSEFVGFMAHETASPSSEKHITYAAPLGEHDDTVAAFLHLAPTLTIVGRQAAPPPPEPLPSVFDEAGRTTLEAFTSDVRAPDLPWAETHEGGKSWRDVVLPPNLR